MKQISLIDLKPVLSIRPLPHPSPKDEVPSFNQVIKEAIQKVDDLQSEADQNLQDFIQNPSSGFNLWEKPGFWKRLLHYHSYKRN